MSHDDWSPLRKTAEDARRVGINAMTLMMDCASGSTFERRQRIEKELAEHPHIDDVFVYGIPASNGVPGEKDVVAAIVPVNRQTFDSDSVFTLCAQNLESNFIPSYLHLVREIPKTASEKPQERFLLEMFDKDSADVIPQP